MTSSTPINKNPTFNRIKFHDGTSFSSAAHLNYDTRISKKLKVENEATFNQNVIIKGDLKVEGGTSITVEGFVTDEELTTSFSNYETKTDKSRYLTAYAPNTLDSNTYPITGLSSNSSLLLGSTNNLLLKNGAVAGKYLKCIDNTGLVGWADVGSSTTTITDVTTNYGPITNTQTQYSFKIVDIGTTGLSTPRGVFYYPNVQSDYITNAGTSWQQQSIVLALGTGTRDYIQTNDNNIPRIYICPFGKGAEALFFKPPLSNDPTSGQTRLSGGTQNETDQFISLESSGIKIKPKNNVHSSDYLLKSTSSDGNCQWTNLLKIPKFQNPNDSNSYLEFESNGNIIIKTPANTLSECKTSGKILSIDSSSRLKWIDQTTGPNPLLNLFIPTNFYIYSDTKNQSTYRSISDTYSFPGGTYLVNFNIALQANNEDRRFEKVLLFLSTTFDGDLNTKIVDTPQTLYGTSILYRQTVDTLQISNSFFFNLTTFGVDVPIYLNIFVKTTTTNNGKHYLILGDYSNFQITKVK